MSSSVPVGKLLTDQEVPEIVAGQPFTVTAVGATETEPLIVIVRLVRALAEGVEMEIKMLQDFLLGRSEETQRR